MQKTAAPVTKKNALGANRAHDQEPVTYRKCVKQDDYLQDHTRCLDSKAILLDHLKMVPARHHAAIHKGSPVGFLACQEHMVHLQTLPLGTSATSAGSTANQTYATQTRLFLLENLHL